MRKLEIPKEDFLAYAMYLGDRRRYRAGWKWVVFKVNYGEWADRSVRFKNGIELQPQKPIDDFLQWVDEYQNKA